MKPNRKDKKIERDALELDAYLAAALRHAPDADVNAPQDISAQIVAAAHRAVAEPPAKKPAAATRWRWNLGASGAFATLLMAGVLGLMWQDQRPGPAREADAAASAQPVASAPQPRPASVSAAVTAAPAPAPTRTPALSHRHRCPLPPPRRPQ
jgi:hypothetical protein